MFGREEFVDDVLNPLSFNCPLQRRKWCVLRCISDASSGEELKTNGFIRTL